MEYDVAIIGCGVIGAATAYALAKYELKVAILEKENDVSTGTTKANSAILHAGYDPEPNTQMAYLNVKGSAMAKDICQKLNVPYKQIGSLVVAFSHEDMPHIQKLYENGKANNVPNIQILSAQQTLEIEPNLNTEVKGALYAPSAAIVSPWEYTLAMAEISVKNGAHLMLNSEVTDIISPEEKGGYYLLKTKTQNLKAKYIVNAAGVHCHAINSMVAQPNFESIANRGEYYLLDKSEGKQINHVIFQCPTKVGKGVLVSPTVHGNVIVGPNAENVADGDDVSTTQNGLSFVANAARKSVPNINLRASIRNFAGVRALTNHSDFIIEFASDNFLNLAGIKSPGLSAAAAIGEKAKEMLSENGLDLKEKESFDTARNVVRFKELSLEEKAKLIEQNPAYGRVICRCETITEGEIIDAVKSIIPPCSLDGVKRRANAGMGRCQGGFCGPRVLEILARELNCKQEQIVQDKANTVILTSRTKMQNEGEE